MRDRVLSARIREYAPANPVEQENEGNSSKKINEYIGGRLFAARGFPAHERSGSI